MEWSEETISRLRSLWQEGLSTAEIGRRLSITKNAVVGKAHRLTLPPRPSPIRLLPEGAAPKAARPPRAERIAAKPPRPVEPPKPPAPVAVAPPLPTATVTPLRVVPTPPPERATSSGEPRRRGQTCCWPLGEPGTKQFRFCGDEPMQGKPYCAAHAQLAYVRLRDRRDTVA
ncbi:GcrA family cell cycle regulator [Lichenicoccus sp.]|uniref:GcrA family cell cycle regulator n=1 Tax=Lichenicoccus sp. TaxID=2781899 RepID=UPI003D0E9AAA